MGARESGLPTSDSGAQVVERGHPGRPGPGWVFHSLSQDRLTKTHCQWDPSRGSLLWLSRGLGDEGLFPNEPSSSTSSSRFQNKDSQSSCNWGMPDSPVFSKSSLLHKLFNPLLGALTGGSRNPQSPEVKGMCPVVYQREYEGVHQKGDFIWGSREKESNTWKGFLEEAAFKLGLEETKKCGFFKKVREVGCLPAMGANQGMPDRLLGTIWESHFHHLLPSPGCPSNLENCELIKP